jgi:hypothetical protein
MVYRNHERNRGHGSQTGMKKPADDTVWFDKGATLSDRSSREEFGLTEDEIVEAVRGGNRRCRGWSVV